MAVNVMYVKLNRERNANSCQCDVCHVEQSGKHNKDGCHVVPVTIHHRLVGLVVKTPASGAEDPGFESRLQRNFSRSSHTNDLKIGTPVTTLPGVWHNRVSSGTGRPGASIL